MAQDQRATRKPRRGRRGRKIITVLVILVGLLVAADFGLAAFAEHTVSKKAREKLGLTTDPSVTVHGFPFITQALFGEYDHISVEASGVDVQDTLHDVGIRADLNDVKAPLSDLLSGDMSNLTIGTLDGQIKLKESDIAGLSQLNSIENLSIEPSTEKYVREGEDAATGSGGSQEGVRKDKDADSDSGNGGSGDDAATENSTGKDDDDKTAGIRLSGNVRIGGEKVEIFAFAMIKLNGTTISIDPQRLQFGRDKETTVVPPKVQDALLPNFKLDINTGNLPFTVTPTAVKVESGAVIIEGEAKNVTFSGTSAGG